jgi:hypothetical protein
LLYKIASDGTLLASFYPQSDLVGKLNLSVVGGVELDIDDAGMVYGAQPVSGKVSVFSPDEKMIREFGRTPSFYRPPFKFPARLPADHSGVDKLLNQWTQLNDIQVLPAQHLLILTYSVHSPMAYGIEICRDDGEFVVGEIGSSLMPAFRNSKGHVVFYDPSAENVTLSEFSVVLPGKKGTS